MSKLEGHIIEILQREKIPFEREKTFQNLRKGLYRFDFYLIKHKIIIECDGPQHFFQVKQFQRTRREFQAAQERDRRKNGYALAYEIPLYRIPFWEIENIHTFNDMIQDKFRVRSKFHNDYIEVPEEYRQ